MISVFIYCSINADVWNIFCTDVYNNIIYKNWQKILDYDRAFLCKTLFTTLQGTKEQYTSTKVI